MAPKNRLRRSSSSSEDSFSTHLSKKRQDSKESSMDDDRHYVAIVRRIDGLEDVIKNTFSRLTEEVMTLRREVTRKSKFEGTAVPRVLPSAPFKSGENLSQLKEQIRDADTFNALKLPCMPVLTTVQVDMTLAIANL